MRARSSSLYIFTNAIQPARRAWHQAASAAIEGTGLSISLASVLLFASRLGPGVQQKTLATEVGIDPAAMVRLLDQGEAAALLVRRDVPGDRRSKVIHLLPKGQRLADRLEETLARLREKLLKGIPAEELDTATRVLRLFEERIKALLESDRAAS
ncbi:MarR family transcriptional regulator, transcriptional regulator for hemolysin [Roseomonas rosea]|uniref:MarR family transcriptional regulator, transcriptional regulator for hemolysin n=1 Tax=Muricoccus roseus TaxID=198092 RepID=A0A1M6PUU9_9PROT|nr:MarR family transcriptional regulator [Roseomonas rosea]SHK11630.1 MarR family transcriptional regulator, transcriptional regulator for hemolysin [Roseomonas rosea]